MSTLAKTLVFMGFSLAIAGAAPWAAAAPGDGVEQPRLEVLETAASACAGRGELCVTAGAASTIALPPHATAVAGHGAADNPPRFSRAVGAGARASTPAYLAEDVPWTVEIAGSLRHAALAGNALFIVYDSSDSKALADHEVTALWQAPIRAGNRVAARLVLSPADGFRAGHTYRITVAQIVGGKQLALAEGVARLM